MRTPAWVLFTLSRGGYANTGGLIPSQLKARQTLEPAKSAVGRRRSRVVLVETDGNSQMESRQLDVDAEYLHDDYASSLRH